MTKTARRAPSNMSPAPAVAGPSDDQPAVSSASGPAADERIRMRAYELYRERGGRVGDDMADWLQAEREYLERAPKADGGQGVAAAARETRV